MNKIKRLYKKLLSFFGKQEWWPVTDKNKLIPEYKKRKRLNKKQKFEISIGAILTQNTSWKNVEKAIIQLNKKNLMDAEKIKKISKKKLAKIIKSSGYYNQKAERLKIFAEFFIKNKNPKREELLKLKGIGKETADSILLYAFNKPYFVIDAYTKRIMQRLGFKFKDYDELQKIFEENLKKNVKIYKEYHALLVELAKNYCKKKPLCKECPIKKECNYKN